jgi:hypothetical protein
MEALGHEPAEWCTCALPGCTNTFKIPRKRRQRSLSGNLYCCPEHRQRAQRKVQRPTAAQLEQEMREIANWTALAQKYGVSDNAVRKWAKHYGLNLALCDGRRKAKPADEP